jgi:hypothetical protein
MPRRVDWLIQMFRRSAVPSPSGLCSPTSTSTIKIMAVRSFETSVNIYQSTQHPVTTYLRSPGFDWADWRMFQVTASPQQESLPGASRTLSSTISTPMKINRRKQEERNIFKSILCIHCSHRAKAQGTNILAAAWNTHWSLWQTFGQWI